MNKKMTDLALVSKWGGLAANGFTRVFAASSRCTRLSMATAPKPFAARRSTLRRVIALRNIDKLISIEQSQSKIFHHSTGAEKLASQTRLNHSRLARQRDSIGLLNRAILLTATGA